jgi:hypothetical protein
MIETAEEFLRLRTSGDPEAYRRAASEPAPESVWWEVIARHPEMKAWVIHNKTVPTSILTALADDPDSAIRSAVAMKRKCDPATLEKLASDPDCSVRLRVAYNPKTPASTLRRMAADEWERVAEVARNRLVGE